MNTNETLEQVYVRTVCSLCKNKENCQEELRRRIDGTIKCEKYDTTFVPRKVDSIAHGTEW